MKAPLNHCACAVDSTGNFGGWSYLIVGALTLGYMNFYSNKMKEVVALEDSFKRCYVMSALKAMMKDVHNHFDFGDEPIPHEMPGLNNL